MKMLKSGALRHVVTVLRPPQTVGSIGEIQGQPEVIYKEWPCSIETLGGQEGERARQNFPTANLKVQGYTDPAKPIKAKDYLQFGARTLNVIHPDDVNQNGLVAMLLCSES